MCLSRTFFSSPRMGADVPTMEALRAVLLLACRWYPVDTMWRLQRVQKSTEQCEVAWGYTSACTRGRRAGMTGLDGGRYKAVGEQWRRRNTRKRSDSVAQTEAPYVNSERMLSGCVDASMRYEKAKAVISPPRKHNMFYILCRKYCRCWGHGN